jgi:hypothetical protein
VWLQRLQHRASWAPSSTTLPAPAPSVPATAPAAPAANASIILQPPTLQYDAGSRPQHNALTTGAGAVSLLRPQAATPTAGARHRRLTDKPTGCAGCTGGRSPPGGCGGGPARPAHHADDVVHVDAVHLSLPRQRPLHPLHRPPRPRVSARQDAPNSRRASGTPRPQPPQRPALGLQGATPTRGAHRSTAPGRRQRCRGGAGGPVLLAAMQTVVGQPPSLRCLGPE